MTNIRNLLLAGAAALVASAGAAHAGYLTGTYSFSVETGLTGGIGFNATAGAAPFSPAPLSATFTYSGALDFDNTTAQNGSPPPVGDLNSAFFTTGSIIGYVSAGGTLSYNSTQVADFTSLSSFLGSSGSAGGYVLGSFYTIDLGTLAAGTMLTITHDDGASVFQGGVEVGTTNSGPTSVTTDTVTLTSTADTILYYSRQNGSPSILEVSVPEPASLALLGCGLLGLGLVRRRKA